jgi:hypothetical protein
MAIAMLLPLCASSVAKAAEAGQVADDQGGGQAEDYCND